MCPISFLQIRSLVAYPVIKIFGTPKWIRTTNVFLGKRKFIH